MAFNLGSIVVNIAAPLQNFRAQLNQARQMAAQTHQSLTASLSNIGIGGAVGAGIAGAAAVGVGVLTAGFGKAIHAASDLNETLNKMKVIFGSSSKIIEAGADRMAVKFGIVKSEFMNASAEIGQIFQEMGGWASSASAEVANQLTKAAADASSLFNVSFEESSGKIAAALRGMSRPIAAYGVNTQEAAVKQEAFRMGLIATNRELTKEEKVTATASILIKGLGTSYGDLGKTQSAYAVASREVWGRITNTLANFGKAMMPIVEWFLGGINRMLKGVQAFSERAKPYIESTTKTFIYLADYVKWAFGQIGDAIAGHIETIKSFTGDWSKAVQFIQTYFMPLTKMWDEFKYAAQIALEAVGYMFRNWSDLIAIAVNKVNMYMDQVAHGMQVAFLNIGILVTWFHDNWIKMFYDAFNAIPQMLENLKGNFFEFGKAIAGFMESGFRGGFKFNAVPLLKGVKVTTDKIPDLIKPDFEKAGEDSKKVIDAIQDKIDDRENERLKPKGKRRKAPEKGETPRPPHEFAQKIPKESRHKPEYKSYEEYHKQLQMSVFEKQDYPEQTARNTARIATGMEKAAKSLEAIEKKKDEAGALVP